jgi:hypothetical protein
LRNDKGGEQRDRQKTIAARTMRTHGAKTRVVEEPALVYLSLERGLVGNMTPSFRRKLFKAIAMATAEKAKKVAEGTLTLDLGPSRREMAQRIKDLRRAERLARIDADVLILQL